MVTMRASDSLLLNMANRYEKVARSGFWITDLYKRSVLPGIVKKLALELSRSGHEALYELIYQKVCEASSKYPARDYGETLNAKIAVARHKVSDTLHSKGFVGEYPRFTKVTTSCTDDRFSKCVSILVTEEHPFTLAALEYENYEFRIQLMVSETASKARYLNQGFFEGNGNKGRIVKSLEEL